MLVTRHSSLVTILHTIETGGPGGAETILLKLASSLDPARFRPVVLLPREGWLNSELQAAGVRTFLVHSKAWYDFRLPWAILRVACREKADLIHSHLPDQNFYSSAVGPLAGCKVVVTYHGAKHLSKAEGFKDALKLATVKRRASAVVVVSDYLKSSLVAAGFSGAKVFRIYNGIELDGAGHTGRAALREQFGCSNGSPLIGTVANIRESKGYDYFLRAARRVSDSLPHARFVAAGELDSRIGPRLLSLRRELGLEDRLAFLGFRKDVRQLLAALDIFVLPSTSEGFSLATVEAMGAGRPVVATRSGGPEEIVEDGVTGFLVPPADDASLAARICELIRNPPLASKLGENAQAAVRHKFSLTKMVEQYASLYETVARNR